MRLNEFSEAGKLPFDEKLRIAVDEMGKALSLRARYSIAFSGGKDSTVLWDMMRRFYPGAAPYVIFGNTGVEYPESLRFARELGKAWGGERFIEAKPATLARDGLKYQAQCETLEWLVATNKIGDVLKADGKLRRTEALEAAATPEMWDDFRARNLVWRKGTAMSYWYCVDQYGWPILGKAACKLNAHRINIDCFLRFGSTASEKQETKDYYDLIRGVKISQMCCTILKKEPSARVQKELGIDMVFLGMMGTESRRRMLCFCENGYLYQTQCGWLPGGKQWHCHPMGIWTDEDVWEYIRRYDVPYSPLYDKYWTDKQGVKPGYRPGGVLGGQDGGAK